MRGRVRRVMAEARLAGERALFLHLYSNGDLVLEAQVIYASLDSDLGFDDAEFFTLIGPRAIPGLFYALLSEYFPSVAEVRRVLGTIGMELRGSPERAVQCAPGRTTVKLRAQGKPWWMPLSRRQTRVLAFEMVRAAFERGLFRSNSDFRYWLGQRNIPWGSYSYY
jgi:hypothetical protein